MISLWWRAGHASTGRTLIKTIDEIKTYHDTHVVFVAPHGKVLIKIKLMN